LIGDAKSISQILTRLIHNAAKYGTDRSEIEIEMSESQKTPHRMKISVFNSGKNIAEDVVSKIMRPFFIDENVMNHSVGMGLGLTVCQCLLKAQQSGLVITNTPSGVEVSFELPCL
jgi:K+-sensing histidine kinase KdpD